MIRRIHVTASIVAMVLVASFWASSALTLAFAPSAHATARRAILYTIPLLIACIATAAVTGRRLAGKRRGRLLGLKRILAGGLVANGLLVLVPCAWWFRDGTTPGPLAATEDLAGTLQLLLLVALALTGRRIRTRRGSSPKLEASRA